MGPERDDELGASEPAEAKRQEREKLYGKARQTVAEARLLVDAAKRIAEESAALLRARQQQPWPFVSTCPSGHDAEQDEFDRATLARRLVDGVEIRLRCKTCGRQWNAAPEQRERLLWAVRNRT
jgi:hypothetical protein